MANSTVFKNIKNASVIILALAFLSIITLGLAFGNLKASAQSANDVFLIDESKVIFSPDRANSPVFAKSNILAAGSQDLTVTVSDSRLVNGATCDIQIRPWPTAAVPNPSFSASSLTSVNSTYDGSCRATLTKANQTTYLWELQIRVTSGGVRYGVDTSYFFLFGAAVLVDITAVPV